MSILENEVWISITNNAKYYEDKGYVIPRQVNSKGRLAITKGTKIKVKIEDLNTLGATLVTKVCDHCNKVIPLQRYSDIIKQRYKFGNDRCFDCAQKANGKIKKNNVCIKKSIASTSQHIISEWNETLNKKSPTEVSGSSHALYWWTCNVCKSDYKMSPANRKRWIVRIALERKSILQIV